MINALIKGFGKNPRRLFVVDGVGAIISAFLLGIVLVRLESIFGIPPFALYILAAIPIFFAIYDVYSHEQPIQRSGSFLIRIAIMNFSYCLLSLGMAIYHSGSLTFLGWGYILIEIFIVCTIGFIELKVGIAQKQQSL